MTKGWVEWSVVAREHELLHSFSRSCWLCNQTSNEFQMLPKLCSLDAMLCYAIVLSLEAESFAYSPARSLAIVKL